VRDGRALFLVAEPVGAFDGFVPVLWGEPRWVMADGSVRSLTEQPWTRADAQWDSAKIAKDGEQVLGVGAQASAVLEYAVPAGAVSFRALATIAAQQPHETVGSVRFLTVVGTAANTDNGPGLPVEVNLAELAGGAPVRVRDLWTHTDLGEQSGRFAPVVPYHGAKFYRLSRLPVRE